eukprot:jgi/Bigna1/90443/estExt_fgenesh1_pg.C_700095
MSQQLEEQQDFGSQAVQGHEQKQERKGDTDAKEGGGTPPQAPPGPAPGIKKADAAAEALENFYEADDEDVAAESKKVVMALRALRPRASNYAKLKVSIEYKYQTHDVWAAIMQDIMDYEADLPPEWAALFRNDGGLGASRGTTQSTVKQQQPVQRNTQFMSVKTAPVMITKYNGKRGEARRCSSLKAAGVATKESSKSRASKKIKARNFLDIVQIDVYKYDGYHYLTFVDVATGKCWVKKIIKVNVAKKNKGLYKQRLTNCYRTWESELQAIPDEVSINKIPKKLHVDNETSLLQLPHPNIDASPVYYAQSNSKVERLHRTLANLSRINSTTPDKIQGLVNDTFTSGGGIKDKEREEGDDNDDDTESEDEKVPYDGRVLKEGQYVRAKVNLRSRNKQDPFWGGVAKVTERKGRKQYYIYDGNRVTLRHISHLKNYDIGEKLLEDVKVNPTVWERAMPCLGPRPKFDVEYGNNKVRVNDDWRMKIVYLGYPGLRNMERVAMKIKDGKYQLLYLAVPDLPFEHWYKVLGDLDAEGWYGHEPKDEGEFWVSDKGDKVREESITWWLVKFRKR